MIILSYEMLLQHVDRIMEMTSLDLIVCDEGHRLKNLEIKTTTVSGVSVNLPYITISEIRIVFS